MEHAYTACVILSADLGHSLYGKFESLSGCILASCARSAAYTLSLARRPRMYCGPRNASTVRGIGCGRYVTTLIKLYNDDSLTSTTGMQMKGGGNTVLVLIECNSVSNTSSPLTSDRTGHD